MALSDKRRIQIALAPETFKFEEFAEVSNTDIRASATQVFDVTPTFLPPIIAEPDCHRASRLYNLRAVCLTHQVIGQRADAYFDFIFTAILMHFWRKINQQIVFLIYPVYFCFRKCLI